MITGFCKELDLSYHQYKRKRIKARKKKTFFNNISLIKSLPNDKILNGSICRRKIAISLVDIVENIRGKGENAGYHAMFRRCFPKPSFLGSLKVGIV